MENSRMPCALCLQEKLLCKSHIIPEFAYKPLYDDKHRMWRLSTSADTRTVRLPKGVYEELLCRDCEDHIGRWETYASQVLNGGVEIVPEHSPFGWRFSNIDYTRFKLFQMSLLWRATVSKRPEFGRVQMSRKQRGGLRRMLMAEDPGDPLDFACLMFASRQHLDIIGDLVMLPLCERRGDTGFCLFVLNGFFWFFQFPQADPRAEEFGFVLSREGAMTIVHDEKHTSRFIAQFASELIDSGNLPASPTP